MAMDRLVSDHAAFEAAWESQPLLSRGLECCEDLLSLEAVAELIDQRGLRLPYFRMVKEGVQVPTSDYTTRLGRDRGQLSGVIDPGAVRECLAGGATLVLQGLRYYCPEISNLCNDLSAELGHPVHANAYLTPAFSKGAGRHYDDHSVFMRQVSGRKRWCVQAPVEQWPTATCFDSRIDTETVLDVTLEPEDCLYLPRGFVHDGSTGADPSLHLSFTLDDPPRWADVLLRTLAAEMEKRTELRSILPLGYASKPLELEAQATLMIGEAKRALDAIEVVPLVDDLLSLSKRLLSGSQYGTPGPTLIDVLSQRCDPTTAEAGSLDANS